MLGPGRGGYPFLGVPSLLAYQVSQAAGQENTALVEGEQILVGDLETGPVTEAGPAADLDG